MSQQKKYYPWIVILLCGCAALLSGCRLGRRPTPTPIAFQVPASLAGTPVASVQTTALVQTGAMIQQATYTGRIVPAHQEDLFFRRSGRVAKVYVKDGDRVKAGDVIAVLDEDTLEIDLESAQLGVQIAQETLAQAEADLTYRRRQAELNLAIAKLRLTNVKGSDLSDTQSSTTTLSAIYQNQLTLAQLALDAIADKVDPTLELNLKRNQLSVEKIKQTILDGQIKVPFDGEVRFINLPTADEQIAVAAFAAVARVVDTAGFQIELNLPRVQLESLHEGMPVTVSAASLTGATIKGIIQALPRPFGTSAGSVVEVGLVNPKDNAKLSENTTVAVNAALQSQHNSFIIPRAALRQKDQLYYVLVPDGDQQRSVNIAVGIVGEDQVEVIAGLEAGQTVITAVK